MTTYTMTLEKVCTLTDTVEIEADSLEEAKAKFEENEQDYFEDAEWRVARVHSTEIYFD